jgi:hypothetical protein
MFFLFCKKKFGMIACVFIENSVDDINMEVSVSFFVSNSKTMELPYDVRAGASRTKMLPLNYLSPSRLGNER